MNANIEPNYETFKNLLWNGQLGDLMDLMHDEFVLSSLLYEEDFEELFDQKWKIGDKPGYASVIFTIVSAILYLIDVGSDHWVIYQFWTNGQMWYFGICLSIMVIESIIVPLRAYYGLIPNNFWSESIPQLNLIYWFGLLALFGLGSLCFFLGSINYVLWFVVYSWNSKDFGPSERRAYYSFTNFNVFFIFLESVLEALPQVLVQTHAKLNEPTFELVSRTTFSIVSSIFTIAWSNRKYSDRLFHNSFFVRFPCWLTLLLCNMCWTLSRIIALTLLATLNIFHFLSFIIIKFLFFKCLSYIYHFHDDQFEKVFNNGEPGNSYLTHVVDLILIFHYPSIPRFVNFDNSKKIPYSYWRFVAYHTMNMVESVAIVLIWQHFVTDHWFSESAIWTLVYLYAAGIGFFVISYPMFKLWHNCCLPYLFPSAHYLFSEDESPFGGIDQDQQLP